MSGHTPGPWTLRSTAQTAGPIGYAIVGGGLEPETLGEVWNTRHEKAIANARLIAAAPDLLDLARALIHIYEEPELGAFSFRCAPLLLTARRIVNSVAGVKTPGARR